MSERAENESGHATILLVDDDDSVRLLLGRVLERNGFRVLKAASGGEALKTCAIEPGIQFVVTDVQMPEMTGPELIKALRKAGCGVPALFISAFAPQWQNLETETEVPLLQKPFSPTVLVERVRGMLAATKKPPEPDRRVLAQKLAILLCAAWGGAASAAVEVLGTELGPGI